MLQSGPQAFALDPAAAGRHLPADVLFGHPKSRQIFGRQIDATASVVDTHIAQDVGELECDTKIACVLPRTRIAIAKNLQTDEADSGGHAMTVRLEIRERLVPSRDGV